MVKGLLWLALSADAQLPPPTQPVPTQQAQAMVRVFLDCPRCDEDYLRREVTFIDYVRHREDADVHLLVTTQETGGGGVQFTLKFIGLGRFQGSDQTLTYNSPQTATADEERAGFAERFRIGLVRYAMESSIADRLRVTFAKPASAAPKPVQADPWNFWVFRVGMSGDVQGEEQQSERSFDGFASATRTTDAWRMAFGGSVEYEDEEFLIDEDDGSLTTILSVNRDVEVDGVVVKSLSQHWSLGLVGQLESATFDNFALRTRVAPGIEYNFFPYSESSRRLFTLNYTIGYDYHRYNEVTIYDKLREQLMDQRLESGISLRQPWGTVTTTASFSQYLTDPSKYSVDLRGGADVRVFRGFSVGLFGEFTRTRDQVYLPRGEATTEEILLRQRQLATDYQYALSFSVSYSFGSIFNNIVNPRFGGAQFDF